MNKSLTTASPITPDAVVLLAALERLQNKPQKRAILFERLASIIWHAPTPDQKDLRVTFSKLTDTKLNTQEFYVFAVNDVPSHRQNGAESEDKTTIYRGPDFLAAQAKFAEYF